LAGGKVSVKAVMGNIPVSKVSLGGKVVDYKG